MGETPHRIGPYEVGRELGRGGMGAVYAARHTALGREVALKVLLAETDPVALERFRREARVAAQLQHPHIVACHDFGRDGTRSYVAMDLVEGESLDAQVKRDGPLEERRAAQVVRCLAEALEETHQRGVLHRDLKPHNVMIRARDQQPLLTDFGLAKIVDQQLTQTGQMLGTPGYMPPEQIDGAEVDARVDVYGLGATLYHLLTGQAPFTGSTAVNVITKVLTKPPVPPSKLRPGLDPRLETICLRCLEKEPARRFAGMAELSAALDAYAEAGPPPRSLGLPLLLVGLGVLALGAGLVAVQGSSSTTIDRSEGPTLAVSPASPQPASSSPSPSPSPKPTPPERSWAEGTRPPVPGRSRHLLVWDVARQELLLLGGFDPRGGRAGKAARAGLGCWRRNAAGAWRALESRPEPEPQAVAAAAYHAAADHVVLFTNMTRQTWTWDGERWTKRTLKVQPPARKDAAMAYDVVRKEVVLFGGRLKQTKPVAANEYYRDTWVWTGTEWLERTAGGPDKRRAHCMVYDPLRERVVLFGGWRGKQPLGDTWLWDGEGWTLALPEHRPPARLGHAMAWDPRIGAVVLFGGKDRVHSGLGLDYTLEQVKEMLRSDTWCWDGSDWRELNPIHRPESAYLASMVFDPTRRRLVLFGGEDYGSLDGKRRSLAQLWEY